MAARQLLTCRQQWRAAVDLDLLLPRCTRLRDTDDTPPAPARAEQHKQQGNQLFKLHDHAAAAEEYAAGLRALRLEARLSTGARCLVNCLDRHPPEQTAIIWEGDDPAD